MRFTVEARDLKKGLKTIALLSTSEGDEANVYLVAKDHKLELQSTGVFTSFPVSVETPGAAQLPGSVFSRVSKLHPFPKGSLTVSIQAGEFVVQRFTVKHPQIRALPPE